MPRPILLLFLVSSLLACGEGSADKPTSGPTGSGGEGGGGGLGGGGMDAIGGGGQAPDDCAVLEGQLDIALEEANASEALPGGVVGAVFTPSCGRWTGAAGEADDGVAMTPETLVRIGSITKTYVAAALVTLAQRGELSLDDSLDSFVTTGVENESEITVRQLLNHTAGVYNYTNDLTFMNEAMTNPTVAHTPQQIVDVAVSHGADFAPGSSWSYSNTGYILLGMVLEAVTGQSPGAYLRQALLDPQALDRTFFDGEEVLPEPLAKGYGPGGTDLTDALHPSVPWTAGIMVSEAGDLVDWAVGLYDGEAIDPSARAEMLTFVPAGNAEYGLGVFRGTLPTGETIIGHGGAIPGYQSIMYYLPDEEIAVAVVVNHQQRDPAVPFLALVEVALQ